jgi:hypothetical protein
VKKLLAILLGACVAGPPVRVQAAREDGDLRVAFRRTEAGSAGHLARLEADGGRLEEVVHSPDRLTVSVLWREPQGELRCSFAYGGSASRAAGGEAPDETVEYVFLDAEGATVTARLPLGNPVRPALPLEVTLDPALLPALLDRTRLERPRTLVSFPLPVDADGALVRGDSVVVIRTTGGGRREFLVGVDPDGTPTATTGYIRRIGQVARINDDAGQ